MGTDLLEYLQRAIFNGIYVVMYEMVHGSLIQVTGCEVVKDILHTSPLRYLNLKIDWQQNEPLGKTETDLIGD